MIKTKQWSVGGGSATIQYDGQGDGQITITSDANSLYEARSMQIVVETTDGSGIQRVVAINQAAKHRIDLSAAVVTASNQTYSGSAKTPTPTVTLNGSTVPSSGYDVSYSNNTNAGTATITITGKGDYTGTAYGTFTINKATPSYTAPTRRTGLTYTGNSQYLTTSGSTSHGNIYYSSDGSSWYTSRRTGTNAGTYYCYWKLVGDANHTDISSTYLGTVSIGKATGIIYFSTKQYSKYGTDSAFTVTPSVTGDGSITYSSDDTSIATVNSSGEVTVKNKKGHVRITAMMAESTNYTSASDYYDITVIAVTQLSLSLEITDKYLVINTAAVSSYYSGYGVSEPYYMNAGDVLSGTIDANEVTMIARRNGQYNYSCLQNSKSTGALNYVSYTEQYGGYVAICYRYVAPSGRNDLKLYSYP